MKKSGAFRLLLLLPLLAQLLLRSRRMKAYRQARAEIEARSEADLPDMGLKRYQPGHVARSKSLR